MANGHIRHSYTFDDIRGWDASGDPPPERPPPPYPMVNNNIVVKLENHAPPAENHAPPHKNHAPAPPTNSRPQCTISESRSVYFDSLYSPVDSTGSANQSYTSPASSYHLDLISEDDYDSPEGETSGANGHFEPLGVSQMRKSATLGNFVTHSFKPLTDWFSRLSLRRGQRRTKSARATSSQSIVSDRGPSRPQASAHGYGSHRLRMTAMKPSASLCE